MIPLLLLLSCGEEPSSLLPTLVDQCDAGDAAWVARAMPLVWGRRAHGQAELRMWGAAAHEHGREAVVRAWARDPAFVERWHDWTLDALGVARRGDRADPTCYGRPRLSGDQGELARYIAANPALGSDFGQPFSMADVIRSGILADDLSVIWRAHLYARLNRPLSGANVGPREMEEARRTSFGESFFRGYLHRNLTCLPCHNSEYSVTGSPDPALDRTWELPGLFEAALLGASSGEDASSTYAIFRYADLVDGGQERPWGMSSGCGSLNPPDALVADMFDHESYFIEAFGETGSVWQIESFLAEGVDALEGGGLVLGEDDVVGGPEAFAFLVAQTIADAVWEEATGSRLTIAHDFPRNEAQRDRLAGLTAGLVERRYSLVGLLVDVTTDPLYNAGPPEACGAEAYPWERIYDPWTDAEEQAHARGNGPGDQLHRLPPRVLLRSVHDSLGWAQPDLFLAERDPIQQVALQLGAYMRESEPGFKGVDFQGLLAFEATYGACTQLDVGGAGNGCEATPAEAGCASCDCQSCACELDSYCCDVQWDQICVDLCNEDCGGCGGGLSEQREDVVLRLLAERDAKVSAVVVALKDRLVADGSLSDEEEALIRDLIQANLSDTVAQAGDLEAGLRRLCGALLLSPGFQLSLPPGEKALLPAIPLDQDSDCARMEELMSAAGNPFSCVGVL